MSARLLKSLEEGLIDGITSFTPQQIREVYKELSDTTDVFSLTEVTSYIVKNRPHVALAVLDLALQYQDSRIHIERKKALRLSEEIGFAFSNIHRDNLGHLHLDEAPFSGYSEIKRLAQASRLSYKDLSLVAQGIANNSGEILDAMERIFPSEGPITLEEFKGRKLPENDKAEFEARIGGVPLTAVKNNGLDFQYGIAIRSL